MWLTAVITKNNVVKYRTHIQMKRKKERQFIINCSTGLNSSHRNRKKSTD